MDVPWTELPEITVLIRRSQAGDRNAEGKLFTLAYSHLRDVAANLLRRTGLVQNACPHELVHDVYLGRLSGHKGVVNDRGHFLALATLAMKNELVDRARHNKAIKRTAPGALPASVSTLPHEDVMTLEEEVHALTKIDPRAAQVLRLRFYGGCSWEETAAAIGSSVKLVRNDWEFASRWLAHRLGPHVR